MTNESNGILSKDEAAYFESGGETPIPATEPTKEEIAAPADTGTTTALPDGEAEKKQTMVPHGALHQEREERKKAEAKLAEIEKTSKETQAKLDAILERFQSAQKADEPAEDDDPEPDMEKNIFEWARWNKRQLTKQADTLKARDEAVKAQTQAVETQRAVLSRWQGDVKTFVGENPTFSQAAEYLSNIRDKQLQALAMFDDRYNDEAYRAQVMDQELSEIVIQSARKGMNSAKIIYDMANSIGFKPTEPAAKPVDESAKIDALNKAQTASKSLSQAGGKAGGDITVDTIMAMTDKQLKSYLSKPENEAHFNKLLGG
jgi:hypothetical protein